MDRRRYPGVEWAEPFEANFFDGRFGDAPQDHKADYVISWIGR